MRFLNESDATRELTYSDVFLVPEYTEVTSRMEVDLTPVDGSGATIPVVVANMNAIAGRRMAETVTRRGGLVVLPQDMSLSRVQEVAQYLKSRHHVLDPPVMLHEDESVQTALNLIYKRAHGAIMVVDSAQRPVGIFTEYDSRDRDRFTRLKEVMSHDMITALDVSTTRELFVMMRNRRVSVLPVISESGALVGVITTKGALRSTIYKPALNTSGEMIVAVALGINSDVVSRAKKLLEFGVDILVLDTAHAHQKKMIDAVRSVRGCIGATRTLVVGNVVTPEATKALIEAGASIVKVGVGPGAMCTTRMMTGMGRPQFSAVHQCASVARAMGRNVWADGGVRHPRDVVLALAAGASCAFFGSWFAGTFESPADIQRDEEGRLYKENFGMASRRAVIDRTRAEDLFDAARKQYFEEGISHSRLYLKPGEESAEDILDKIAAGVRSACTYAGGRTLDEFYRNAVIGVQTRAGYEEGKPLEKGW